MKVKLIALGKCMPTWATLSYTRYARRLHGEASLELLATKAEKRCEQSPVNWLHAQSMLVALGKQGKLIAVNKCGKLWNTRLTIQLPWHKSNNMVCLLSSGADGFAFACKQRVTQFWSLSTLTLPYVLIHAIVAKRWYRAWTILTHHPHYRI